MRSINHLSEIDRLRWLLVHSRFPGLTLELQDHFWHVIDDVRIVPPNAAFEAALRNLYSGPIDLSDLHQSDAPVSGDVNLWASRVYGAYDQLDTAVSKKDESWFRGMVRLGPRDISAVEAISTLKLRVEDLEKNKYDAEIELSPKRLTTLYKIVLGLAVSKFHYAPHFRGSAAENMAKSLGSDFLVTAETILKILRAAVDHLDYERGP